MRLMSFMLTTEQVRQGFAGMVPEQFVLMFIESHGKISADEEVTRIEFEYV